MSLELMKSGLLENPSLRVNCEAKVNEPLKRAEHMLSYRTDRNYRRWSSTPPPTTSPILNRSQMVSTQCRSSGLNLNGFVRMGL
eukprot:62019-Amphidinium_carterae.1